jgi:hydroxymethylpyrimidine pyrophosphatase-like HAD family hydrolase
MKRLPDDPLPADRPPLAALYADLDGTLLGPGGSMFHTPAGISGRAAGAVEALQRAGVTLVLVSGRTRDQMREAARILAAPAYIAELGAFLVERDGFGPETVVPNLGAFEGEGTAFDAIARAGAGGLLLERYAGRLEPHTPWAFQDREATMLLRGLVDPDEATAYLATAGFDWLELHDNGIIRRPYETLDVPEVRAYHLVPKGVTKRSAIAVHLQRHGIDPAAAAAVGDSRSDLDAHDVVGLTFIVANGLDAIGDAADGLDGVYLTPGATGDGFADAVESLLAGR